MPEFRSALSRQWSALRQRRWLMVLWILLMAVAVGRTTLLSIFMVDPAQKQFSTLPMLEDMVSHSCLTAYAFGSELASEPPDDMYAVGHYEADTTSVALDVAPFDPEPFQYPPQFLLPLDLLRVLTGDFLTLRVVWYFLMLFASIGATVWIAKWIGGDLGAKLLLWSPILWATPFFTTTLQLGNLHFVLIAMCLLAMIAFERGKTATGGLMLAYAISSKIFPGIFGIYLLVQKRWRDAAWTAGFGVALAGASWIVHGKSAMVQFLTLQLPRLADGSAFEFFRREEWYPLASLAFRSVVVKLHAVGLIDEYDSLAGPVGLAYTLLIVPICIALAFFTTRKAGTPRDRMALFLTWSTVLALASFQGTFTPMPYAPLGPIWLMVAVGVTIPNKRWIPALVVVWMLIALPIVSFAYSLVAHIGFFAFLFVVAGWRLKEEMTEYGVETEGLSETAEAAGTA